MCLPPRLAKNSLLFSSQGSFPPGSLIQALGQAGAEGRGDRGGQDVVREDLALAAEAMLELSIPGRSSLHQQAPWKGNSVLKCGRY